MFRYVSCILLCTGLALARVAVMEERLGFQYRAQNEDDEDSGDDGDEPFPVTSFTCKGKIDGFYADVETGCKVYHYCQTFQHSGNRRKQVDWKYNCPETTIFNQELLTCTSEDETPGCQDSEEHFDVNQNLTSTQPPTTEPTTASPATTTKRIKPSRPSRPRPHGYYYTFSY